MAHHPATRRAGASRARLFNQYILFACLPVGAPLLIGMRRERNRLKFELKIAAAGCLLSSCALADTVELVNGDRLSGTIVSMEAEALALKTLYAGTLKLPWGQVSRIASDTPVRVRLADGTELDGQLHNANPRQVRIRIGSLAETAPLALDRIAAINPPRHPHRTVLSARSSIGGSFASGNSDAQSVHLDGEWVARNPTHRVTLGGELNEASQDGVDTASNWRLGLKYDHFVNARTYFYANTRFDHDGQADLDLRSTIGGGVGRQILDRDDLKLSIEGGLSLVKEDYAHAPDERFPGARVGARYEQDVWQGRLTLFHTGDLLLSLESLDDYLYQSRTGFRVPVGNGLSLGSQVNFDYDGVPAAGKNSADTTVIVKLDYTL